MDLTFVGWIVVGLIAGLFSAVVTGGRTPRGWIPSLIIGLIAAWLVGWLLVNVAHVDAINSIWLSALLAAGVAVVLRLLMKTFDFAD
jgi:uncharacterized membrane protein YeaQ/YmgE (transglycosylase-associated protein family)